MSNEPPPDNSNAICTSSVYTCIMMLRCLMMSDNKLIINIKLYVITTRRKFGLKCFCFLFPIFSFLCRAKTCINILHTQTRKYTKFHLLHSHTLLSFSSYVFVFPLVTHYYYYTSVMNRSYTSFRTRNQHSCIFGIPQTTPRMIKYII